jgi:uncharacterized protein YggE
MQHRKLSWISLLAVAAMSVACTAEKTQEGELPDVDVSGGQLPKFDVDPATVEVSQDTQTIITPDVDVVPAEPSR